ncbi:hypothetical protein BCUN_1570 [Bifidobacterium cuniculi]|uniref:Uncharacterized protein n=1 Tax=Bifidobacterium cuniculi TaxID=1688 RepID=A0A087AM03_9BIFI|nr:hypothetical protein BCUN_1570 [Bifidobacterium cuniculi]
MCTDGCCDMPCGMRNDTNDDDADMPCGMRHDDTDRAAGRRPP